jgi:hypothetical protein
MLPSHFGRMVVFVGMRASPSRRAAAATAVSPARLGDCMSEALPTARRRALTGIIPRLERCRWVGSMGYHRTAWLNPWNR